MTDQQQPTPGSAPDAPTQPFTPPPTAAAPVTVPSSGAPAAAGSSVRVPSPPTPSAGRAPLRWAAAIAVVTLVLGATLAVAALLTGGTSQATVLRYVPQDTVIYGELRLDLPGDQRQAAAEFLSKFPGFADQAALETKLDETLDRLIGEATDGSTSYTGDIKPWFDGELAFSIGPIPAELVSGGDLEPGEPRALFLLSVKDQAAASAWFESLLTDTQTPATTETYQGVDLTVVTPGGEGMMSAAFAILGGNVAVVGDITSVKAAIDTNGTASLASDPEFQAAEATTTDDYIGFAYVDMATLMETALDASDVIGAEVPAVADTLTGLLPAWAAFQLRVESDALLGVATSPHVDRGFGATTNRVNEVVDHVPDTAVALVAGNEVGATWLGALEKLGEDESIKGALDMIDGVTGVFGGMDEVLGWIGDAGFVVNATGSEVEEGFVIVSADPAKAENLFNTLKTFIALGGGTVGLSSTEESYGDTTITTVSVDLAKLGALAGGLSGGAVDGLPIPAGTFEFSFAVADDVVVIGNGPAFVKHVLDTEPATSLSADPAYQGSVGRIGADATGVTFVDIEAIRTTVEAAIGGDELAEYTTDVQPFLEPFVALASTAEVGGDLDTFTTIITVK